MSKGPLTLANSLLIFKDISARGFWMTRWYAQQPLEERVAMINDIFELSRQKKFQPPLLEQHEWLQGESDENLFSAFSAALSKATGCISQGKQLITVV